MRFSERGDHSIDIYQFWCKMVLYLADRTLTFSPVTLIREQSHLFWCKTVLYLSGRTLSFRPVTLTLKSANGPDLYKMVFI